MFQVEKESMQENPVVFIKELSERDRPFMLNHFLGLSATDRRLRFGAALPDEAVHSRRLLVHLKRTCRYSCRCSLLPYGQAR